MPRYVIDVQYKGTAYSGWQLQANATETVQAYVEKALSIVLRTPTTVYGAGRTDAGVHATKMPAHFDYEGELHPSFMLAMNAILPPDIAVMAGYRALIPDFHARYKARRRAYQYHVTFRKTPVRHGLAWWTKPALDLEAMAEGAAILPQYSNFKSFAKAGGAEKFICKITKAYFEPTEDGFIFHIEADRFLRGMVRAIMGTLVLMGEGKLDAAGLRKVIEAENRAAAGPNAPPDGLFLCEVQYPECSLELLPFDKPNAPKMRVKW
jgi:tRNA pseudouridine38-40 synthase